MNQNHPNLLHKYNTDQELKSLSECLLEQNRFANFSARNDNLLLDFSRTGMQRETLSQFLDLFAEAGVEKARQRLFAGEDVNFTENRPALHMAMRNDRVLEGLDSSISSGVAENRQRMLAFASAFAAGHLPGKPAHTVQHIVHIGIGGSYLGPRLLTEAVGINEGPKIHFLSSVDAHLREQLLSELDPRETAVVIATKSFTTGETLLHGRRVLNWMESSLGRQAALERIFAVSGNRSAVKAFGLSEENSLYLPDWVGGRYSIWSAVSVAAAAVMGDGGFTQFLRGAADMDDHFESAALAENLPVLAAIIGVWNRNVCGYPSQAVIPYDYRLRSMPSYLQQLVMESNGKSVNRQGQKISYGTSPVVFGEPGTDAQHSLFQMFHQGSDIVPLSFIGVIRPDHQDQEAHAALLANMLAQATALATGTAGLGSEAALDVHRQMPGERPSEIILLDKLNPYSLGQLLALYEHKVFVESVIWDINPFDQFGVELGKVVAKTIQPALEDASREVPENYGLDGLLGYIRSKQ